MKVLFLKDVPGVGKKNDIKEVNDGFARNFLFAKKLAVLLTDEKLRSMEREKAGQEEKKSSERAQYLDIADSMKSIELVIATKVGEKGKTFGSVSAGKIKKELEKRGVSIEESWIDLEEPLKTTGSKQISLRFPHGVSGFVTVTVKPE